MKQKRILFIASHRKDRAPGQRFRFEQYMAFLEQNGFHCELSPIISETDDKVLYQKGKYLQKFFIALRAWIKRQKDAWRANQFDIIFIFREAFLTGSTFFERQFRNSRAKIVFDFDDAIWHLDVSDANKRFDWLKEPGKTAKIISVSDMVLAGNQYLADYAKHHNNNVKIIPTTIDTNEYLKVSREKSRQTVCIGWSGSITTIKHFEYALPALKKLKEKYGEEIIIKVIGDASYENTELNIKGIAWNKKNEIQELSSFDIGIMPLPNDEWAKGKCGLKGLQYMALEIPCIMSPVGVNSDIITDGINGYLAKEEGEWIEKISALIENPTLRHRIGVEARKTVEEKYSVNSQKEKYLGLLNDILKTNHPKPNIS